MPRLITAAALAAALSTPAAAQVAGVYTGTSADGSGLTFTVGTDGNGDLAVISAGLGFSAPCKPPSLGTTLNTGWGFGADSTFKNHKTVLDATNPYFTFIVKLTFADDGQSATGTIESISPTLYPVGLKPKKALYCKSPTQALSVTLQPPGAHVSPQPPIQAVQFGRPTGR